jgi:hypothetical protein
MIKNICKNIITDTARYVFMVIVIAAMSFFPSCRDYLDIVPDDTMTLDDLFSVRAEAYDALAKVYSYMPEEDAVSTSTWLMGDEYVFVGEPNYHSNPTEARGNRIMRGLQETNKPILGTWTGTQGGKKLYEGISICNIFIDRIDEVKDMQSSEKAEWKAQAKFLKAYYHFLLLQKYGPIVITDKVVPADAPPSELYVSRNKIDDCFNYIVRTMDEAIPDLTPRKDGNDLGKVDMLAAASIKARVLLFRASPFYGGKTTFFSNFLDHDKKPFFPIDDDAATTKAKWKDAVDAINQAIELCQQYGRKLYTYTKPVLLADLEDLALNKKNIETLYDLRMVMADPWNEELIWGSSYNPSRAGMGIAANIKLPQNQGYVGDNFTTDWAWNCLSASYRMVERYYTKNGLPLDEDKTFSRETMHELTVTPGPADPEYPETRGILQPNAETINLYLNRELRFYANLGITGSYFRSHTNRIRTQIYAGQGGGYAGVPIFYLWTGIGIQKVVHINSKSGGWSQYVRYPAPIIRMADLYLMKAEALNEYLDAPNQEVYEAINTVRRRAGIPTVEEAYTGTSVTQGALNKHTKKTGMREIILQERGIELAFEGSRFWDMLRYNRAPEEFSTPVLGWMEKESLGKDFFRLEAKESHIFTVRDCLYPIDLDELNINSNLIQNPAW